MAFIRVYSAQGDPRFKMSTMRAGRLMHAKILSAMRGRGRSAQRKRTTVQTHARPTRSFVLAGDHLVDERAARESMDFGQHATRRYGLLAGDPFSRAMRMPAGDPFSLRVPKFIRKLSIKKVAKGLGKIVQPALSIASQFLPGFAGKVATGLSSLVSEHAQAAAQGPPSAVAAGYMVPGITVSAEQQAQDRLAAQSSIPYTGARSRGGGPDEEEEPEEEPDYGDTGDEGEDTGEDDGSEEP